MKKGNRLYYILDKNKNVKAINNLLKWATWMETNERNIAFTKFKTKEVSTVFLGLDHNFGLKNEPILFETMVFSTKLSKFKLFTETFKSHKSYDKYTRRYATKAEAIKGHDEICKLINKK